MKDKSLPPGSGSRKRRLEWRPANALSAGAASRAAWSKGGGKGGRNPRGRKPKRQA